MCEYNKYIHTKIYRTLFHLRAAAPATDTSEHSCWWILYSMSVLRLLRVLWEDRGIDRAVSMTRASCDASFAKLASLVASRDSRHSENQRIIRDLFPWLARFVFGILFQHH